MGASVDNDSGTMYVTANNIAYKTWLTKNKVKNGRDTLESLFSLPGQILKLCKKIFNFYNTKMKVFETEKRK